ncbi:tetraspanin-18-like [Hordeum vulgare]|nr:tetraspanin-18-like [Hordeum vulgare]
MDRGGRSDKSGGGCGRCCLGFLLKLLAFLQAFAALSVVLYAASILSAFILSRWTRHHELHIHHLLPDLWFACAVMAAGLLYCAIFLAGYVAAEVSSGCCVCFRFPAAVLRRALIRFAAAVYFWWCRLAVKKSKAEKNHNKPKRPSSAFFVFI